MARSAPFLMPRPSADSGPVSGAMTPSLTVLLVLLAPPPVLLEQPVAASARMTPPAPTWRNLPFKGRAPFLFLPRAPGPCAGDGRGTRRGAALSSDPAIARRTSHRSAGPGRDRRTVAHCNGGDYVQTTRWAPLRRSRPARPAAVGSALAGRAGVGAEGGARPVRDADVPGVGRAPAVEDVGVQAAAVAGAVVRAAEDLAVLRAGRCPAPGPGPGRGREQ